jgi:RNA polymerase sigma-70 factor, ECF subfamily
MLNFSTASDQQRSDSELMLEIEQGDDQAVTELLRRYQAPLIGYITRIINDRERARDLCQETFIRVLRHAARYRRSTRFATWLYHIARNIARDELRRRRRRPEFVSDQPLAVDSRASAVHDIEVRELVEEILLRLTTRDRNLLVLRDLKGLTYEEIANETGLALGTVKSALNRARGRFREHYAQLDLAA